jgi:hypothetical protein
MGSAHLLLSGGSETFAWAQLAAGGRRCAPSAMLVPVRPAEVARTHAKDDSAGSRRYNNFDT